MSYHNILILICITRIILKNPNNYSWIYRIIIFVMFGKVYFITSLLTSQPRDDLFDIF